MDPYHRIAAYEGVALDAALSTRIFDEVEDALMRKYPWLLQIRPESFDEIIFRTWCEKSKPPKAEGLIAEAEKMPRVNQPMVN
jgi:hypothetical protein